MHRDNRAVSTLIGALFLFAILIIAFSVYQATAVPAQNKEVEFTHNQEVQDQFQTLRDAILSAGATGSAQSATITLGMEYPARIVAVNPPPAWGRIQTVSNTSDFRISNATIAGSSNAQLYWGSQSHSYNTTSLAYIPHYREYRNAPTTQYEQTLLYNDFEPGSLGLVDQSLIHGNRINTVLLVGDFRESGVGATTVTVQPDSIAQTSVPIESDGTGPITLTFPTHLEANRTDVFLNPSDSHAVTDVSLTGDGDLRVTLAEGQQYSLRMARVGIGSYDSTVSPAYIVALDGTEVLEGQSFTVEVRDRFNNPVSGVDVVVNGCGLDNQVTNGDGQLSLTCSDVQGQEDTVELSINGGGQEWEDIAITVNAPNPGGGPGNGGPPGN